MSIIGQHDGRTTGQASLDQTKQELEQAAARLEEAESELSDQTFTGVDRKRIATVTVKRDGTIHSLKLDANWRKSTTPTRLASSVIEACSAARTALQNGVSEVYAGAGFGTLAESMAGSGQANDD